jgi:hypothetical protein
VAVASGRVAEAISPACRTCGRFTGGDPVRDQHLPALPTEPGRLAQRRKIDRKTGQVDKRSILLMSIKRDHARARRGCIGTGILAGVQAQGKHRL